MNVSVKAALATALLLTAGLFAIPAVLAVTINYHLADQGGPACQLSVPTISSQVRPRASGMRNEGSANAFVICQFASSGGSAFKNASLHIVSTDGKNHSVTCTGMIGEVTYGTKYSTKTFLSGTEPSNYADFLWLPADFASSDVLGSYYFSATCNLPPGASITTLSASYNLDVGA